VDAKNKRYKCADVMCDILFIAFCFISCLSF